MNRLAPRLRPPLGSFRSLFRHRSDEVRSHLISSNRVHTIMHFIPPSPLYAISRKRDGESGFFYGTPPQIAIVCARCSLRTFFRLIEDFPSRTQFELDPFPPRDVLSSSPDIKRSLSRSSEVSE